VTINEPPSMGEPQTMCRNIKTLHNFKPPATSEEMRASALQYVRKLSGMRAPSRANQPAFDRAVEAVYAATTALIGSLDTHGAPRTREQEQQRARERGRRREQRLRETLLKANGRPGRTVV
jgi:hypothetical protein